MEYSCYACDHKFDVALDKIEIDTAIAETRREECPKCDRIVGRGSIVCWSCRTHYEARVPHWHKGCNLAIGDCPTCGRNAGRACLCKNLQVTASGRTVAISQSDTTPPSRNAGEKSEAAEAAKKTLAKKNSKKKKKAKKQKPKRAKRPAKAPAADEDDGSLDTLPLIDPEE